MLFPVEIYPKSSYKFIDLSSHEYFLRDSEQREEFVRIFTKKTFSEFRAQSTGAQRKILDDLVNRADSTNNRIMYPSASRVAKHTEGKEFDILDIRYQTIGGDPMYDSGSQVSFQDDAARHRSQGTDARCLLRSRISGLSNFWGTQRLIIYSQATYRLEQQKFKKPKNIKYFVLASACRDFDLCADIDGKLYAIPIIHTDDLAGPNDTITAEQLGDYWDSYNNLAGLHVYNGLPTRIAGYPDQLIYPTLTDQAIANLKQFYLQFDLPFEFLYNGYFRYYSKCSTLVEAYDSCILYNINHVGADLAFLNYRKELQQERRAEQKRLKEAEEAKQRQIEQEKLERLRQQQEKKAANIESAKNAKTILPANSAYKVKFSERNQEYVLYRNELDTKEYDKTYENSKWVGKDILDYLKKDRVPFRNLSMVDKVSRLPTKATFVNSDEVLYLPKLNSLDDQAFADNTAIVKILLLPEQVELLARLASLPTNLGAKHVIFILPIKLWKQPGELRNFSCALRKLCSRFLSTPYINKLAFSICLDFQSIDNLDDFLNADTYKLSSCVGLTVSNGLLGTITLPGNTVRTYKMAIQNAINYLSIIYNVFDPYLYQDDYMSYIYRARTRSIIHTSDKRMGLLTIDASPLVHIYDERKWWDYLLVSSSPLPITQDTYKWLTVYQQHIKRSESVTNKDTLLTIIKDMSSMFLSQTDISELLYGRQDEIKKHGINLQYKVHTLDTEKSLQLLTRLYNYFNRNGGIYDDLLYAIGVHPSRFRYVSQVDTTKEDV